MMFHDGRFAKYPSFTFFAMNTTLVHQASPNANAFMKNYGERDITVQKLHRLKRSRGSWIILWYILLTWDRPNVTGVNDAANYCPWLNTWGNLHFFTLSVAGYRWPDLFKILSPNEDYGERTPEEKMKLIHANPIIVGNFVQNRVEMFAKHVFKPILKVR